MYLMSDPPAVFSELGLDLAAPGLAPIEADALRYIAETLETARAAFGGAESTLRAAEMLSVVEDAAARLLNERQHHQLLWLIDLVAQRQEIRGSLARFRMHGLRDSGDIDGLFREIDRLDTPACTPPVRDLIGRCRLAHSERLSVYDLVRTIGCIPESLEELCQNLRAPPFQVYIQPELSRFVYDMRHSDEAYEDFHRRMAIGHHAERCINLITRAAQLFQVRHHQTGFITEDQTRVINLNRAIISAASDADLKPLRTAYDAGQSILFSCAHASLPLVCNAAIGSLGHPVFRIRAGTVAADTKDRPLVVATGTDLERDFAKLVKQARREQVIVSMVPDGLGGGDPLHWDLLGRRIALRQGAAMIGFHGAMATFFCQTRLTDTHIELVVTEGPTAQRGMDREVWDKLWYDFYLQCLAGIVLGEPEDMGGNGGLWASLMIENRKTGRGDAL